MSTNEELIDYPNAHLAAFNLRMNREAEHQRIGRDPGYTPPDRQHYRSLYPWDECMHAITYARNRETYSLWAARTGLSTLYSHQLSSGLVPNQIFAKDKRKFDPEIILSFNGQNHTQYGQPPLGAMAAIELYSALKANDQSNGEAENFLTDIYGQIAKESLYWIINRRNSDENFLIGNIRPEETGRDEAPDLDNIYKFLPFNTFSRLNRQGEKTPQIINLQNTLITQANRLILAKNMKNTGLSIEAAKEILWFNDVAVNCLTTVQSYITAEIANMHGFVEDKEKYSSLAKRLEDQILSHYEKGNEESGMWWPESKEGVFYGLDKNMDQLSDDLTVSNLFVLLLPNLKIEQLKSTLDLIESNFLAEHGITTVDMTSPNYDPHYKEKESKWRGPSWLAPTFFISEGLLLQINRREVKNRPDLIQRCKQILNHATSTAVNVLNYFNEINTPFPEFYNPHTAKNYRSRVKHFGMTNLGYVMPPNEKPSEITKSLLKYETGT